MEPEADDWSLLFAWREGDQRAADQLAGRYFPLLMRFFLNKVRNVDDASDLVSETFLGCSASRNTSTSSAPFRSYLFAIAMNKLRGYYRKQSKRRRELDDFAEVCVDDSLGHTPSSLIGRAQETRLLVRGLRRLNLAQQIVIELAYFEDMRGREIAELLEIPTSTVHTHLARGRKRLAEIVAELSENPDLAQSTMTGLETWCREIRANI